MNPAALMRPDGLLINISRQDLPPVGRSFTIVIGHRGRAVVCLLYSTLVKWVEPCFPNAEAINQSLMPLLRSGEGTTKEDKMQRHRARAVALAIAEAQNMVRLRLFLAASCATAVVSVLLIVMG